ncbi:hypothetical protein ColTof4_07098 [Colletotrichum tofieldiae]|nr:hypothetical protein ColTof3_12041 [Colletotrichum tofieldiae]GKT74675.1 hypothetical protein ColTof4_07098 [Colletotrichum tofieldiae]GKT91861.1 hypothetical protein Ct61P_09711 [Colletotrichum tofieldiae]
MHGRGSRNVSATPAHHLEVGPRSAKRPAAPAMEPAGLAVGILGLAGLFSTCLEAVDSVQSYRSARADADVQDTLFNAAKARFEQWGRGVGIEHGRLLDDHHPALDDKGISTAVGDLLHFIIKFICDDNHSSLRHLTQTAGSGDGLPGSLRTRSGAPPEPRRRKLAWALRGKGERTEQVNLFVKLVQGLYNLVSPDTAQGSRLEHKSDIRPLAETRREIQSWLGHRFPNERYHDSLQRRLEGTCDWILSQPAFLQWLSPVSTTNSKLLWINGPPGFGKTILCARIVEHLSSSLQTPVAHFFFSSDLESRNDPFSAIRSWISQVVSHHEDAFEYVRQMLDADLDPVATRATSMIIFTRLLHIVPGSIYVIDGLDECTSSDTGGISVAAFLRSVADAISGTDSKVLLVSRDEHRIRNALGGNGLEGFTEHKISPNDVRQDTTAVSRDIVDRKLPNKGDDVRSTLSEAMTSRCDGQFLWLKMQEESLRKGMNQKQLQQAVNDSPTGLDRLYDNTWAEITRYREPERLRTFALLRWAAFATRPLTVSEITEAAVIDDHGDLLLEDLPDAVDEDYVETEIVGLCSPLLEVRSEPSASSPGQQTVHLVHFTVREYLLPNLPLPNWLQQNEHLRVSHEKLQSTILAKACLHYINSRRVWTDKTLDSPPPLGMSFRNYAATSWHRHIKFGIDNHPEVSRLVVEFFSRRNSGWEAWRVMMESEDAKQEKRLAETDPPGPLYYAVRFQLMSLIIILVSKEGCDVNEASELGRSALHRACWDGAVDIVAMLLESGANAAVANKAGWTPIQTASDKGHINVVRLLLESGADATAEDKTGRTPIYQASLKGHIEIVKLLLENGANVTVADHEGLMPIHAASCFGHIEVVKLLLEKGAGAAAANKQGRTPIFVASVTGNMEVVKLLLEKGADADAEDKAGWTPMHSASEEGRFEMVKLLLEKGVRATVANKKGRTPIYQASLKGNIEVVKLLLENGADAMAADNDGWLPMHAASLNGHVEVIKLLIENGADIAVTTHDGWAAIHTASLNGHVEAVEVLLKNGTDIEIAKDGWTSVHIASIKGHVELVKLLLDNGASATVADEEGYTSIHVASEKGHTDLVKLLIERGADITAEKVNGSTPMGTAANGGHVGVVKLLIEKGADVTVAADGGWTPIISAANNGHLEVVKLLIEKGAEPTIATDDGWTPINMASDSGHTEVVRLLVEKGADITAATDDGWKPITSASNKGHLEVVKLLIEKGADITAATDNGWTPVHVASDSGHTEVVRLLVEKGADIATATNNGWRPIISASNNGHIDVVELLIEEGADITATTDNGWTPVHVASDSGHTEVVRLLIDKGADITTATNNGWTPIISAANNGHLEVVKMLIEEGADITAANNNGETPLHSASESGHAEVVQLLLNKPDVEVDGKDNFSRTPLFLASRTGYHDVVQLLLADSRVDPASTDWYGSTPLFAAVRNGHTEASEALLTIGAVHSEPEARDGFGRTLRWWAHRTGNSKLVELLAQHADRVGSPVQDVVPVDTLSVSSDSSSVWCDACTLNIAEGCNIGCDGEEFDLCAECFNLGIKCPNKTHTMLPMPSS